MKSFPSDMSLGIVADKVKVIIVSSPFDNVAGEKPMHNRYPQRHVVGDYLHIDGESTEVDAPPDIIDVPGEDDDISDDEDPLPHDLADRC
ncbi:hypothetical protein Tco_0801700 [Tanacetum coccineum]|uniref:Uncharacterized protein n=1 Tax=Tanacetum coccineum TaxID=301880 RepID=A0ABQ5A085_9ASTR